MSEKKKKCKIQIQTLFKTLNPLTGSYCDKFLLIRAPIQHLPFKLGLRFTNHEGEEYGGGRITDIKIEKMGGGPMDRFDELPSIECLGPGRSQEKWLHALTIDDFGAFGIELSIAHNDNGVTTELFQTFHHNGRPREKHFGELFPDEAKMCDWGEGFGMKNFLSVSELILSVALGVVTVLVTIIFSGRELGWL